MNRSLSALPVGALMLAGQDAHARTWPSKPIKWVVPFAPGGTTDTTAQRSVD